MLKPGDIVTVADDYPMFERKQGQVAKVQLCFWEEPEVEVCFDPELFSFSQLGDDWLGGKAKVAEVIPMSLLRREADWAPEVWVKRLFRHSHHFLFFYSEPLDPGKLCMVKGCDSHREKCAWVNVWGSVFNVHVCAAHAKYYHGYCLDSFPWRPKETEQVAGAVA